MKILLINTNRYRTPPVPPLALEYLQSALMDSKHECRLLDLCFVEDPSKTLEEEVSGYSPHIAGLSIRNTDTVLYQNNIFFLDEIKSLVDCLKSQGIPVLVGGIGYSFIPEGILEYLGADWGIQGPGEKALVHFLDQCETDSPPAGTILDGWEMGIDPDLRIRRGDMIDYGKYVNEGGLIGFETQKGCFHRCSYCPEGRRMVLFRNPIRIVEELIDLADRGFTEFHLCDTEFNQDLAQCHTFLKTLIEKGPPIRWALYMKCTPYDEETFRLLKKSGAHLITLSIPTGSDSLHHAGEILSLARKYGIQLAVDLLCGFPGETVDSVKNTIEYLRKTRPDTVGINSTIRLFPDTDVARTISLTPLHQQDLCGEVKDNPAYIRPVFYQHISIDTLREITGDDPLFRIEGFERTTNYERLKGIEVRGCSN